MKNIKTILAIDTSCDETSVAVTQEDRVLTNIIASQIEFHKEYGGVVPMLAKRMHLQLLDPAIKHALSRSRLTFSDLDAIAITIGPGLAPALEVGIEKAKELAQKHKLPIITVNHLEAHLLSSLAKNSQGKPQRQFLFPLLGVLVSGRHTELVLVHDFGKYEIIGQTQDDAAGEAFDKVARMLNLGYPGGPIISEFAKHGKPIYKLPIPMLHSNDLNFSYSGLKTACLYKLKELLPKAGKQFFYDFSASFEQTIVLSITLKLDKAIRIYKPKQIVMGGGVFSNLRLRNAVRQLARKNGLPSLAPVSKKLFNDNAAMVGVCAWYQSKRCEPLKDITKIDRIPQYKL
jgi:N6-L-threonylcarbamoyladenine synthase